MSWFCPQGHFSVISKLGEFLNYYRSKHTFYSENQIFSRCWVTGFSVVVFNNLLLSTIFSRKLPNFLAYWMHPFLFSRSVIIFFLIILFLSLLQFGLSLLPPKWQEQQKIEGHALEKSQPFTITYLEASVYQVSSPLPHLNNFCILPASPKKPLQLFNPYFWFIFYWSIRNVMMEARVFILLSYPIYFV